MLQLSTRPRAVLWVLGKRTSKLCLRRGLARRAQRTSAAQARSLLAALAVAQLHSVWGEQCSSGSVGDDLAVVRDSLAAALLEACWRIVAGSI